MISGVFRFRSNSTGHINLCAHQIMRSRSNSTGHINLSTKFVKVDYLVNKCPSNLLALSKIINTSPVNHYENNLSDFIKSARHVSFDSSEQKSLKIRPSLRHTEVIKQPITDKKILTFVEKELNSYMIYNQELRKQSVNSQLKVVKENSEETE